MNCRQSVIPGRNNKSKLGDWVGEFVIKARIRNLHPPLDKGHSNHRFAKLSITHTPPECPRRDGLNTPGQGRTRPLPVLFQCLSALLLNNWQSRKPRIFKALASMKGPF
jgi:hypothetical protein